MLQFLRKHQRYFFAVITFVIIISFSFFGTYNAMMFDNVQEPVAFTAIDGTDIKRTELDDLVVFLGTDSEDKLLFGGVWGPNFLNDGVVKKDFLQSGLAEVLAASYADLIVTDLQPRLEKEKRFVPYVHPRAKFLSAESAWAYLSPNIKSDFDALRTISDVNDPKAFSTRINLFIGERKLPSPVLRQVLRYQEKQYGWLTPDENLQYLDLSLFGYHTAEDWFGPRFMRIIAQFILNSSKIAEQKGYKVTKEEALADLLQNSATSYQQNSTNPNIGVANQGEYFNEQLRRLGMDQSRAVKIWQRVMLFRRVFDDVGNSVITDTLGLQKFNDYARESIEGDLYRLPEELRFSDFRSLQKFETYVSAVSKKDKNLKTLLRLPTEYLSVSDVSKKFPELTQKRYLLRYSHVNKNSLQIKVGIKEMWNWEVEDLNWATLKEKFPELGMKNGDTRDERFAALDSLDDRTRNRVDAIARKAIVDSHPEWLQEALQQADAKQASLGIRPKGGKSSFIGVEDREELIKLLDKAPIAGENKSEYPALAAYSGDGINYYRIDVLEKSPHFELLTFADANKEGVLDQLLDRQLEAYYLDIRNNHADQFQKIDQTWKEFADVKNEVATYYFENVLKAIRSDYAAAIAPEKAPTTSTDDVLASLRFYSYAKEVEGKIKKNSTEKERYSLPVIAKSNDGESQNPKKLNEQWKLERIDFKTDRSSQNEAVDGNELFALPENGWTIVHAPVNGDIYFFQLRQRGSDSSEESLAVKAADVQNLLADDAKKIFMQDLIRELKEKKAISLEYMNTTKENRDVEVEVQAEVES